MLCYFIAHFIAVLTYAWPREAKGRFYNYSFAYVYPYFHQNWTLFVPPPKENYSVYVKYKTSKGSQDWKDLFYEINSAHQNNRLGGNEALLLSLSNSLRQYTGTAAKENNIIWDSNSIEFSVLKKIVVQYLEHTENEPANDLEIIIGARSAGIKPIYNYCKN